MIEKLHTLIDEVMAANNRGANVYFTLSIQNDNTHYIHVYVPGIGGKLKQLGNSCYYRDGQWLDHGYDIDNLIQDVKLL